MLFFVMGTVSAAESINVSQTEDSNLMVGNDDSLSAENKLEISSEDSISETNIVNSHDDNLGDYSNDEVLNTSYGNNQLSCDNHEAVGENTLGSASSSNSVVADSSSNDIVGADSSGVMAASQISTSLQVSDTHYTKSATYFDVTLKDKNGKALSNQNVSLKVKGKTYFGITNKNGIATVKTACLAIGSYTVSLAYAGNSNYGSSSFSRNVKVLSSIIASDLTKYCGYASAYKATFWKGTSVLSNTKVTFRLNGKTYTRTTNQYGVASLDVSLAVGKYQISVDNPYSGQKVSHTIKVKKEKTSLSTKSKYYIHANKKGSFTVVLKTKHNALLKNKKISFTYNNKTVTSKTNANGEATISIPVLAKGTYKISFKYKGDKNYYSKSGSAKLIVAKQATKLSSSILVMSYNDGSNFKVKLTNNAGKALANKNIYFKISGKTAVSKTNSKGIAKLSLNNIVPGSHVVKYSYLTKGSKYYSAGSNRVIILKLVAKISANDLTMKPNDGSVYKVTVKDKSGKLLKGVFVKSTINGKDYLYQSDSKGIARLKITDGVGYYSIKSIVADSYYKSSPVSKHVTVKGMKFIAQDKYVSVGDDVVYSVKLVNERNVAQKNKKVSFTFKNKNIVSKTNANGFATVKLGVLAKGTHNIKYSYESASGSSNIFVVSKATINEIISASQNVKSHISKNHALPSTVKIGDSTYKTADYLYLASKAIVNLKAGNKNPIPVKILKNPTKPKAATSLGYLKDYNSVAKKVVNTAESKGILPNSVSSKVGDIGYDGLVYAFSEVLTSYGKNNKMPSYVAIKSLSGSKSTSAGGLNSKNTIKDLTVYLAASKNCAVNNAKIKQLVSKLTKDCKTEKEKANAIFKYVRDTTSYNFYFDTKYGSLGTLSSKAGNCVDHSHLLAAMFRTAGLATRYVHATCHFYSGNTYGHVWVQVLIGNTWTVADATSSRNSLGKVGNWNTNTYKLHGYYASISF